MKKLVILAFVFMLCNYSTSSNSVPTFGETERIKITKDILNNLTGEKFEEVRKNFHSSLKTTLPTDKIAEVWQTIVNNSGNYKSIVSTTPATFQGYNQVKIRIKFEKENATLETTFNEDDQVLGLFIKP